MSTSRKTATIVTFQVDHRRVRRRLAGFGVGLATAGVALVAPPIVGIGVGVLGIGTLLALLARSDRHRVRIGADAVAIELGMSRTFIPLEDIRSLGKSVNAGTWQLVIERRDGSMEHVETDADWLLNRGVLADAIKQAIQERRASREPGLWEERLRRGTRTAARWLTDIEHIAEQGNDYRVASVSHDELAQLAADPFVTLSARVAAAWALRVRQPRRGRRSLRALIAEVVQPELREALRALATTRKRSQARALFEQVAELLGGAPAEDTEDAPRLRIASVPDASTAEHAEQVQQDALAEQEAAAVAEAAARRRRRKRRAR